MYSYVGKRLLVTIPVLLGVVFIVYAIMSLTPGDPGRQILGSDAPQEAVDQLNHELGYDLPFPVRFYNYIKGIVTRFDFGKSYQTSKPVINEIMRCFPNTLKLASFAIVISVTLGISLGILSAVKQYSVVDNCCTVAAMVFAVIPAFWLGMLLIYAFALKLGWLPSYGIGSWKGYILPSITVSTSGLATCMRMTRTTMLETIRMDYIRTARAKGAPEKTIIWRHALRNALLPIITSMGMVFGYLLGGTIVIENVFAYPGLGDYMISAIRQRDVPAVLSSTLFFATLFCLVMLVIDLVYAFIDPRIKARYVK